MLLHLNMTNVNTSTNWSSSYPHITRAKLNGDMLEAQWSCWVFDRNSAGMVSNRNSAGMVMYDMSLLISNNYNDNDNVA
jgi:hypothetical protein